MLCVSSLTGTWKVLVVSSSCDPKMQFTCMLSALLYFIVSSHIVLYSR